MKITRFECWKEDLQLSKPYTIANKTVSSVENFFVSLKSENGIMGLGSGAPAEHVTGENFEISFEFLKSRGAEFTVGRDVLFYQRVLKSLLPDFSHFPAARAALDIALHDLFCLTLGIPLSRFLGGKRRGLDTSVTVGIMNADETLSEVKEYISQGFRVIKLKVGQYLENDIERCRKIRETFGKSLKVRVDANQGYNFNEFLTFMEATRGLDLEFCEQPLRQGNLNDLRSLPKHIRLRTAADEDIQTPKDAIRLSQEPIPYGVFNVKLMKCGGILPALQIGQIAGFKNIDLMWGCMDESKISISAALHAALSSSATKYLDLDGNFDLAHDMVTGGYVLMDGKLHLTKDPGLGVRLK